MPRLGRGLRLRSVLNPLNNPSQCRGEMENEISGRRQWLELDNPDGKKRNHRARLGGTILLQQLAVPKVDQGQKDRGFARAAVAIEEDTTTLPLRFDTEQKARRVRRGHFRGRHTLD